jgi:hypothetical protein
MAYTTNFSKKNILVKEAPISNLFDSTSMFIKDIFKKKQ